MKKLLCISAALVLFDQLTKHLARHFVGYDLVVLIPGVLNIAPFHNTYLGWLGWWGGIVYEPSPLVLDVLVHVFYTLLAVLSYKYFCFLTEKNRPLLNASFVLALAGMGGSFTDDIFFGGSWDFIYLFDAIIMDFKDVFLIVNLVLLILFGILYIPQYVKLNKEQRKRLDFSAWIKGQKSGLRRRRHR